jgi:hypothetical protein
MTLGRCGAEALDAEVAGWGEGLGLPFLAGGVGVGAEGFWALAGADWALAKLASVFSRLTSRTWRAVSSLMAVGAGGALFGMRV